MLLFQCPGNFNQQNKSSMNKTVNQKAWFLVLPVLVLVAFSAVIPLMTVVNYSVQDTFGNNQFFWAGLEWFADLLDSDRMWDALGRQLIFSGVILAIEIPLGVFIALNMPKSGFWSSLCLVLMSLPLLIPWNVVGTIWQIFARSDIGLLGAGIKVKPLGSEAMTAEPEAPAMVELTEERRARLVAYVEANTRMPKEAKARILSQLSKQQVPAQMVERIESRMGS